MQCSNAVCRCSTLRSSSQAAMGLGACRQEPASLPTLNLETLSNWWATAPEVQVDELSTLRMEFTFENASGVTLDFEGDAGGADPLDELQIWTVPNVADPGVSFTSFPQGSYAVGATVSWDIVVDLTTPPFPMVKRGSRSVRGRRRPAPSDPAS